MKTRILQPTDHEFWNPAPLYVVLDPECRILMFIWSLGPYKWISNPSSQMRST